MLANFGGHRARFALKNSEHRPHQFWLTPCLFVQYHGFIAEAVSCPSIAPVHFHHTRLRGKARNGFCYEVILPQNKRLIRIVLIDTFVIWLIQPDSKYGSCVMYSRLQNRLPPQVRRSKFFAAQPTSSPVSVLPNIVKRPTVVPGRCRRTMARVGSLLALPRVRALLFPRSRCTHVCIHIPFAGACSKSGLNNAPFGMQQRWRNQPDQVLSWR
jgi:hypothetical protein